MRAASRVGVASSPAETCVYRWWVEDEGSRAEHTAELMHQVLGTVPDRTAVLARFITEVSPQEAETMRQLLGATLAPASASASASTVQE